MAIETQYNIVKVNELRQITEAQGKDEIIINDIDSFPLETKKITAEDFAISIKDYILPIASETVLGGIKVGPGLTINPVTGVLTNDILILDDLEDVFILNATEGDVLRYKGNLWVNEPEGGITNIIAGEGLYGGGYEGEVVLNVSAGNGLRIENDAVTVNVRDGLEIVDDYINVRLNPGLTFLSNAITIVPGTGLNIQGESLNFVPGLGLTPQGGSIRVDNGKGLYFSGNKLQININENLNFDDQDRLAVFDASYVQEGISKFAPLVDRIEELRGTPSYEQDQINPAFVDTVAATVPTGAVFWFASRNTPAGYLFCDGRVVPKSQYPYLFQILGTTYNTGGESANVFRIPDLRDEFIRGATSTDQVASGGTRNRIVGSKEDDKVKRHNHKVDLDNFAAACVTPGAFPTTRPSGFVWGFTMNNCSPPHRSNGDGTYTMDAAGDHFFNFETGQYELNNLETVDPADASPFYTEPNIPPGCSRVEIPVRLDVNDDSLAMYPEDPTPADDLDETRPRNVALLPCIKT